MSTLVTKLKAEHANLTSMLQSVGKFDEHSQKHLLMARDALLAHLRLEDEQLYPALRNAALKNPELASKLDMFASEMDVISKSALNFFEKYSSGGSGIEFTKELATLIQALSMRIRREETMLYVEYDKLGDAI